MFVQVSYSLGYKTENNKIEMRLGKHAVNIWSGCRLGATYKAYYKLGRYWSEPDEIDDMVKVL